jgi:acetyl-CoA carboxylase beta subunit
LKEKNEELKVREAMALLGGGQMQIDKQHERGKLSARERIDKLVDPGSFMEIEMFVTHQTTKFGMDKEKYYGDGVVTGSGKIAGRQVYLYSQDFTVMGGSLGKAHAGKICHVMDMAIKTGAPIIGLIDSGGARIQEGLGQYGSIFFRNTLASGIVPQLCLILGPCAGGAVYSPALCDFVFMVDGISKMHITGPNVIKAVTGEEISAEELGGAKVHSQKSGVAHLVARSEQECFEQVKKLLGFLPSNYQGAPPEVTSLDDPDRLTEGIEGIIPESPQRAYDMKRIIRQVADHNDFFEIQEDFARNILIGVIRREPRYRRLGQIGAVHPVLRCLQSPDIESGGLPGLSSREAAGVWRDHPARGQDAIRLLRGRRAASFGDRAEDLRGCDVGDGSVEAGGDGSDHCADDSGDRDHGTRSGGEYHFQGRDCPGGRSEGDADTEDQRVPAEVCQSLCGGRGGVDRFDHRAEGFAFLSDCSL